MRGMRGHILMTDQSDPGCARLAATVTTGFRCFRAGKCDARPCNKPLSSRRTTGEFNSPPDRSIPQGKEARCETHARGVRETVTVRRLVARAPFLTAEHGSFTGHARSLADPSPSLTLRRRARRYSSGRVFALARIETLRNSHRKRDASHGRCSPQTCGDLARALPEVISYICS
eukprot:1194971-Prorocentrum_minimum.AAC.6